MTAAYRFRGLGWFLAGVVVVLGFYLVSLQVATERKRVEETNRAIAKALRDIRALETEFDTRANLAQLERWNGEVLALAAPAPDQFVPDEAQLARIDFTAPPAPAPTPIGGLALAALVVPNPPAAPAAPAANPPAAPAGGAARAGVMAASTARSARTVALLDRKLMNDSTLGDLLDRAKIGTGAVR